MNNVQIVMNEDMRLTYEAVEADRVSRSLPPELDAIAVAGFVASGDRLYLRSPEHSSLPPETFDDWEAERWVNKIHLDSTKPPSDPVWRTELLGYGLKLARQLVQQAGALTSLPVQAVVNLQSAEGKADPEIDFATGAVHVYVLREARDDLSDCVDGSAQPTLVLTTSS